LGARHFGSGGWGLADIALEGRAEKSERHLTAEIAKNAEKIKTGHPE
jgi:hypothetical protein